MNSLTVQIPKITKVCFAALVIFVSSASLALAEFIPQYEVTITLDNDGSFQVEEVIYYDFGRQNRHGILRHIPLVHPQESSSVLKNRFISILPSAMLMDDEEVFFTAEESAEQLLLKLGDPNSLVTTEHKYFLEYEVDGALHYFADAPAELYWDAIGTEWPVTIERGIIRIVDEPGLLTGEGSCYVGGLGSNRSCGEVTKTDNVYSYTVESLAEGEGVTVALALKDETPVVILERYDRWLLAIPVALLGLLLMGTFFYRYKTRFKTGRAIIAEYEPYAGLKPMYTGVLLDDTLHPHDITAGIVYLAEQGYLKIKKVDKKVLFFFEVDDYEVTLIKAVDEKLSRFETDALKLLFGNSPEAGAVVTLSDLKASTSKQLENQKLLMHLSNDIKKDLVSEGFFQRFYVKDLTWLIVVGSAAVVITLMLQPIVGILLLVVLTLFLAFSRRRTRKGYEALDHLKGFKDFLKTTEKERYTFHNAPAKSPEQFMAYLPYAIAFGVEQEWAEAFKDITIPAPEWYDGGSVAAFSASNLTSSLGAFSTSLASSSGSTSGSGGGGSVGGGGGGGGGGSW